MFDTNKNYWLYIAPYVYCCIKETQAILYNTKKGVSLETDDKNILVLLRRLHEKKNLGAIYCTGELLSKNPYKEFITNFCQKKMGDVVDVELMSNKPIQMMPILNLQSDINKIQKEDMGKDILHYLLELNIYLHNNCEQRCLNCDFFYRQSLCCKKDKGGQSKEILGLDVLKSILEQIQYSSVARLNLLGGNIFKYPYYSKLSDLLANCGKQIHIWNHYANFSGEKIIFADFHYEVVITFPINYQLLDYSFNLLRNNDVKYHFHITDIEEYEKSENLIKRFEINDYRIHPIYTIKNHIFSKNIYTQGMKIFIK
ncbi:MAG: hypothetical protein LRY59_04805 [Bacteroides graminisolvens]|nr:hypothetical protein [Bacteroides graminisolvens]